MKENLFMLAIVAIVAIAGLVVGNLTGALVLPLGHKEPVMPPDTKIIVCQSYCANSCDGAPKEEQRICVRWCGNGCRWALDV